MKDIEDEKDIKNLLDTFYEKVKADNTIGFIFNEVAQLDWEEHMPKIYAFWEGILLGKPGFSGDVMGAHIKLNRLEPLTTTHFNQWINLFTETVHQLYKGLKADEAINRALMIRRTMEFNLKQNH